MRICAFTHCHNGSYRLSKWKGEKCDIHNCLHEEEGCSCPLPFALFTFPVKSKRPDAYLEWVRLIYRKDPKTGKNWLPKSDDRVCSDHFPEGKPTEKHPNPCMNLPAGIIDRKRHRSPPKERKELEKKVPRMAEAKPQSEIPVTSVPTLEDHTNYTCVCECPPESECQCGNVLKLKKSIAELKHEFEELKDKTTNRKVLTSKNVDKTLVYLKTNKKVRFYTGLPNKAAFMDLYTHVMHKASRMRYWQGDKRHAPTRRIFRRTPVKLGPKRKLTLKEELLIVLMKLRLGLINEVLADMFGVSPASVSIIFNTWIKLLSYELKPLIFYPDKYIIKEKLPQQLRNYPDLRCTLDCTEVFIDRPRHLELQALTWSDYKKHNTIKFLVGIAPNGHISFVSPSWGGRASDQHIVRQSGFLDLLEYGDLIMADRGFTIQEDLLLRGATLKIPPPSSGLNQMTGANVAKTKAIANARIHVERAIGRMKWFSILRNVLPITLVPIADDIITVCAALCNLLPPLVI